MKISINRAINRTIYFTTDFGSGKATWQGEGLPLEQEYFVEFDIKKKYCYEEINAEMDGQCRIELCDEKLSLTMLLTEYEESGCAIFQIGDSLIQVETYIDERFSALINSYVTIDVEELNVYNEFL